MFISLIARSMEYMLAVDINHQKYFCQNIMHLSVKYYQVISNKENAVSFTSSRWYIIFDCKEDKRKGILMLRGVQIDLECTVNLIS